MTSVLKRLSERSTLAVAANDAAKTKAAAHADDVLAPIRSGAMPAQALSDEGIIVVRAGSERIADLQPLWESLHEHYAAVARHLTDLVRFAPHVTPGRCAGSSTRNG